MNLVEEVSESLLCQALLNRYVIVFHRDDGLVSLQDDAWDLSQEGLLVSELWDDHLFLCERFSKYVLRQAWAARLLGGS